MPDETNKPTQVRRDSEIAKPKPQPTPPPPPPTPESVQVILWEGTRPPRPAP